MATKRILFYATKDDLIELIKKIEAEKEIKYFRAGLLSIEELKEYASLIGNVDIEGAKFGDCNLCSRYLIVNKETNIKMREVPQLKGNIKYAIDQKINGTSVIFRPCGIFKAEKAIIEGEFSTIHSNKDSVDIFNGIAKKFKSGFAKIKGCFVGNEALKYYNEGWRLTQNVKSHIEYDFQTV